MQAYTRKIKVGDEHMVGMNRETEPLGMIRAVFDLLDHFRDQTTHAVIANAVLGIMNDGKDLSEATFNGFVAEHQEHLDGREPMKQYGAKQEPIRVGCGSRDKPPNSERQGKFWPEPAWDRFNEERARRWNALIRFLPWRPRV